MKLANLLKELLIKGDYNISSLSKFLNVSEKTVHRWIQGKVKPKIEYEIELRKLLDDSNYYADNSILRANIDHGLRSQFDKCFLELRESLHRWTKLSSRNESIEELSKLLLAQIKFIKIEEPGLERYYKNILNENDAEQLIKKINATVLSSLPEALLNTMPREEFSLKIKKDEVRLLDEICYSFSLVDWTQLVDVIKLDIFNEAFGKFLSDSFVEEKQLGQYLTPIEMVRFMVSIIIKGLTPCRYETLIDPKNCTNFGFILDPSCGVGSFIIELTHQLMPRIVEKYGEEGFAEWLENMSNYVFVCLDKSNRMLKIAATNLASIGIKCRHIYSLNSLDRKSNNNILQELLADSVALILTNPPFGAEFRGKDLDKYKIAGIWNDAKPKKVDSELLFIERYIDWLKVDGQCVVVIPENILTNKGIYANLRKAIAKIIEIHGIISFPSETFSAAGTTAKTSILHFTKTSTQKHSIYFAVCKEIGFKVVTKGSHKQKLKNNRNDLPLILDEYFSALESNSFGRRIDLPNDAERWDATFHATLSDKSFGIIYTSNENISVSDVAKLVNFRTDPRRINSKFRYIEISDIDSETGIVKSKMVEGVEAPSRARKIVKFGDVLASTVRPEQRKIGVVANPLDDGAICTTGLAVLRPINIEPYLLAILLRSDFVTNQLVRFNIGVAYPTVDENCFSNIVLPISKSQLIYLSEITSDILNIEKVLIKKRETLSSKLQNTISSWLDIDYSKSHTSSNEPNQEPFPI